jgi:hypothetical protein
VPSTSIANLPPGVRRLGIVLLLGGLLALRVGYGLSLELRTEDDVEVYLLGLKYATTGQWPYFGADVVHGSRMTQVPGALQGLVVGVPLALSGRPEAPLVLLNLVSFAGLVAFGLYLSRRYPIAPAWLTCAWLLTLPSTLDYSVHVYNPSYLLAASCLFFVAFLELLPATTATPLLPPAAAFFLLGATLVADLQFHSSWPLLLPFVAAVVLLRLRAGRLDVAQLAGFVAGALVPAVFLVPTVKVYGVESLVDSLRANAQPPGFHPVLVLDAAVRFLMFAAYKMPVVFGKLGRHNLAVMRQMPWLLALFGLLLAVGAAQLVVLAAGLLRPRLLGRGEDPYRGCRPLVGATVLLLALAFAFTPRPPVARNFLIVAPVALLAGYLTFAPLATTRVGRRVAIAVVACSALFHAGFATTSSRTDPWSPRRTLVARALQAGDYHVLGARRAHTRY